MRQQIEQSTPTIEQLNEAVIDTVFQPPLEGDNVPLGAVEETAAAIKANVPSQST